MNRIEWLGYNLRYDYVQFCRLDGINGRIYAPTTASRRRVCILARKLVLLAQFRCSPTMQGWCLERNLQYESEVNDGSSL